eukprot:gnl/TRDRNA2_/TRDRNA2_153953_c0_seq4.p1 gnl/TRDRNA2_/TRDRNA2_153953_c0~~gnl/TRDRNA2_/TRDRNA2_153953_c0_seq4.p1  ORF type:complete len:172 (-),score=16.79 gnl/TRDRNA2_/TRDRNA2_153953_c0_seq4:167-682(-)
MAVPRTRKRLSELRKAERGAIHTFLDDFSRAADGMSLVSCGCVELDELTANGITLTDTLTTLDGDENDDSGQLLQPLMSRGLPPAPRIPRPGGGCGIVGGQQIKVSSVRPGAERVPDGQCGEYDEGEDGQCGEDNKEGHRQPGWESHLGHEKPVPGWLKGDRDCYGESPQR